MKYIDHSFTDDPVDVIDPNETVGSSGVRRTSSTSGQSQKDISQTKVVRRKEVGRQFSNRLLNVLGDSNSLMDVEKELLWDVSNSSSKQGDCLCFSSSLPGI